MSDWADQLPCRQDLKMASLDGYIPAKRATQQSLKNIITDKVFGFTHSHTHTHTEQAIRDKYKLKLDIKLTKTFWNMQKKIIINLETWFLASVKEANTSDRVLSAFSWAPVAKY